MGDENRPFIADHSASQNVDLEARATVLDIAAAQIKLSLPPEITAELAKVLLMPELGGGAGVANFIGGMFRGAFGDPRAIAAVVAGIRALREAV